jgi:hypothetical protein
MSMRRSHTIGHQAHDRICSTVLNTMKTAHISLVFLKEEHIPSHLQSYQVRLMLSYEFVERAGKKLVNHLAARLSGRLVTYCNSFVTDGHYGRHLRW